MKNTDIFSHVRGESIYLDDVPLVAGTLFAAAFGSPHAHGVITKLDFTQALQMPGVVQILTYKDIPGENQIGGIVPDEPLLAEHHVHFQGMPVALVLAETEEAGQAALKKIIIEIDPLPIITDAR
jgi:xanthine dehydrogenase large subunit